MLLTARARARHPDRSGQIAESIDTESMAGQTEYGRSVVETFLGRRSLSERDSKLLEKCSDDIFLNLGVNFDYSLGISLGLGRADIEAIKRDNDTDQNRVIALLWKWKKVNGSDATYLTLIESLIKCQNVEAADNVIQYLYRSRDRSTTPFPSLSIGSRSSKIG